jgi:hypothetical protein
VSSEPDQASDGSLDRELETLDFLDRNEPRRARIWNLENLSPTLFLAQGFQRKVEAGHPIHLGDRNKQAIQDSDTVGLDLVNIR